jgi:hypothetical protein
VRLPAWVALFLGLAGWAVYIGDRLLDARGGRGPLRERHRFHWRHRRIFAPVGILAAGAAVCLAAREMPVTALVRTGTLGAAALVYFGGVHSPWPAPARVRRMAPKELVVGVLFTLACAGPTLARMDSGGLVMLAILLAVGCFVLLAWLNCYAIESWETARDLAAVDSRARLGEGAGCGRVFHLAMSLSAVCLLMAGGMIFFGLDRIAALVVCAAVSAGLLAGLDRMKARLSPLALRTGADAALLAALLVFFIR